MERAFGKVLIAGSIFFAFAIPALGQGEGSVVGTIKDARTGQGLNGANVMLEETGQGAAADAEGNFRLPTIQPGSYTLIASFVGYRTIFEKVAVAPGEETHVLVELVPEPIQLHRILVQSDPASVSAASSRPVREFDFRVRPRHSSRDLLQMAPGVVTARHAGGKAEQIFLRGFDSGFGTDVAVAVDGMPVNLVSHGHGQGYADLHFLIPEVVERVAVFKGPYFAEYGNLANAGQIAFRTRDRLSQNAVRIEGGRFSTARYTMLYQLPSTSKENSAYFAGDYFGTDGPFDSPQDLHRLTLFAKVQRRLSPDAILDVSAGGVSSAWDASGLIPARAVEGGKITRWGSVNDAEGGSTARQNLNLIYRSGDGKGDFTAQAYLSDYSFELFSDFTFFFQDPIFGDMIEQTDSRWIAGLNSRYRFGNTFGPVLAASTLGGGFRADSIDLALWQVVRRRRYWPLVDAKVRERNFFLWGQEELTFGPGLRLVLGLRGDFFTFQVEDRLESAQKGIIPLSEWIKKIKWEKHTGARGKLLHVTLIQPHASGMAHQSILSPKVNLIYSPAQSLDLFANFGTGFHSNDARSVVIGQFVRDQWRAMEGLGTEEDVIIAVLDTLNFDVEQRNTRTLPRTVGAEAGFRVRMLGQGGRSRSPALRGDPPVVGHYPGDFRFHAPPPGLGRGLNIGGAVWWIDVEDEFIYAAEAGTTEKRGRTRRWGIDLEARAQVLSWLWADADVNWSRGFLRDAPEEADEIPLAPRFTSTGGLTAQRADRWEASFRYRHIGDRPATEDGDLTAEGYTVFDLAASYHTGNIQIDLVVENLFDVEWKEAQFAVQSLLPWEGELRLRGPGPGPDIHFTPGSPFNVRIGVSFFY